MIQGQAKDRRRRESPTMLSRKSRKSLRKDLPPEVLEIVFAFLPAHVVCRFRVVCKAWNHLILQPGFASLRALTPRQASSILISPKLMEMTGNTAWYVLDAGENRSYKLPHDKFVSMSGRYKYTLAADGGLIYTMYSDALWTSGFSRRGSRVHIVCNLVSKSFHEIPEPELYCSYNRDIVVMLVDNVTKAYKIITITTTMESLDQVFDIERAQLYLYDSTTSMWRKLCEAPVWGIGYHACSSIFVNGILYTLFAQYPIYSSRHFLSRLVMYPKLYSCDLATGVWSRIKMDLIASGNPHNELQLVVSLNRLFMVEYTRLARRSRKQWVTLSIWEIVLAKRELVKVADMRKFCKYSRSMLEGVEEVMGKAVVAVGCANMIVISSLMGRRMKFDLLERRWYELPPYTPYNEYGSLCQGICSGVVDV